MASHHRPVLISVVVRCRAMSCAWGRKMRVGEQVGSGGVRDIGVVEGVTAKHTEL